MTTYRMYCPECGADGTTDDGDLADDLVQLHAEERGHSPRVEVLDDGE